MGGVKMSRGDWLALMVLISMVVTYIWLQDFWAWFVLWFFILLFFAFIFTALESGEFGDLIEEAELECPEGSGGEWPW
jgi:hypothetical protein